MKLNLNMKALIWSLLSRPEPCLIEERGTGVPISHLAEIINESSREAQASGLVHFIVGHFGDGNFQMGCLIDPHNIMNPGKRFEL